MTALDESTVQILTAYAEGDDATEIAKSLHITRSRVSATLFELTGYDRDKARQLVHGETIDEQEPDDFEEFFEDPEPVATQPTAIRVGHVHALLDEAEATGDKRLMRMAAQARELLAAITGRLEDVRADLAARAEVARLEAELAEAKSRLRARASRPTSPAEPPAEEAPAASTSQIRAWAIEHGLDCPRMGRLPAHVLAAWNQNHRSAA